MHHMNSDKVYREKTREELHKNAPSNIEQIQKATSHERAAECHQPSISQTIKVRTRYAGYCWRSKDKLISDILLWTLAHGRATVGRPAKT